MRERARLFATFLYGVNIPGGVALRTDDVETKLAADSICAGLARCVGDADNIIVATHVSAEAAVADRIVALVGVKCAVAVSLELLRQIFHEAGRALTSLGLPDRSPFRVGEGDVEWEFGLVLSALPLPSRVDFRSERNARPIAVLRQRALLAQKRRATPAGSRIMWGKTVIGPLRTFLRGVAAPDRCLTSRGLGTVDHVLTVAEWYEP